MSMDQKTISYKTFVKESMVEALRPVFNLHPDELLRPTKVTIEFPNSKNSYPAVVVRFFERKLENVGIGHYEILEVGQNSFKFEHYYYTGDIEFGVYGLSSYDRDLISDALAQTIAMGDLTAYTRPFKDRFYDKSPQEIPKSEYNFVNLNTDTISGYGESQTPAPWQPEDTLVYQTSYRVGVLGEFYSLPPASSDALGYIENVITYPYLGGLEPVPTGDPAITSEWVPDIGDLQEVGQVD